MNKLADFQGIKFLAVDIDEALKEVVKHIPKKNGDYFCFANIHVVREMLESFASKIKTSSS
jgi:hypothetical protein